MNNERDTVKASIEKSDELKVQIDQTPEKFRLLTGDRPTGRLHLGHYFGTLKSRVDFQNKGIQTFIVIADYQVITDRQKPENIQDFVYNIIADYIASGIDPKKSLIFTHSSVSSLHQLMLPFLSLVSDSELYRNPTVKAEQEAANIENISGLLLTYPIHQATDILFCNANIVPVGIDQLPHIEISRQIARRFNKKYEKIFLEPNALLTNTPLLLGLDGRKMSKSYNNAIELGFDETQTKKLIAKALTDSERNITFDPINRQGVALLLTLGALTSDKSENEIAEEIGNGGAGALKECVADLINSYFKEHREKRLEIMKDTAYIKSVLKNGSDYANEIANDTINRVHKAMKISYF